MGLRGHPQPGDSRLLSAGFDRYSACSLALALTIVILASAAVCHRLYGVIDLAGMIRVQKETLALQLLDAAVFLSAFWAHYVRVLLARRARAFLDEETDHLLAQTTTWKRKALHESTHDPLTGLPNRALFYERAAQSMREAAGKGGRLAMLLVDIDGFREVNDAFGVAAGDQLLNLAAVRLRQMLPRTDIVGRLDGDEFALLLLNLPTPDVAVSVAGRVRSALETPFIIDGNRIEMSASVGISLYPEHGDDANLLLGRAEAAMIAAKRAPDGFVVYSESQADTTLKPMLTADLRHAIEYGQLELHFQPQVDIARRELVAVEALLRWVHPQHGFIGPQEFVPLAERTRLIRPLTNWVLRAAVGQFAAWRDEGLDIAVAVNIAGGDIIDPALCSIISETLSAHGMDPSRLTLEITEGTAMSDDATTRKVLGILNRMGVRLSIDDFGTGYSSLSYLSRLPVQELKIDKSFVLKMLENHGDHVIVESTIGLAHNLGLQVVAEGVENAAVWERLAHLGCDIAQGYHLSRPMPADELPGWVKKTGFRIARPALERQVHGGRGGRGAPDGALPSLDRMV
jgi:diguanylate cyclase (GGDEF)-like protein